MSEIIRSKNNTWVKKARALRRRKHREEENLFLVEGIQPVGAALEAGWALEAVFYAPDLLTSRYARGLLRDAAKKGIPVREVDPVPFRAMTERENPQGILAFAKRVSSSLNEFSARNTPRLVVLVSPQNPGNIGTILRTLEAAGADGLLLLEGGADIYHPASVRASMGAIFRVPFASADWESFTAWASGEGIHLLCASARGETDYLAANPLPPWALLLGNEQKGLSKREKALCETTLFIPMRGNISSLNLAVSAGILLYALIP